MKPRNGFLTHSRRIGLLLLTVNMSEGGKLDKYSGKELESTKRSFQFHLREAWGNLAAVNL